MTGMVAYLALMVGWPRMEYAFRAILIVCPITSKDSVNLAKAALSFPKENVLKIFPTVNSFHLTFSVASNVQMVTLSIKVIAED